MTIKRVTVLGAGVLGAQIAYQIAYSGFDVVSYDINDDALASAAKRFDKLHDTYAQKLKDANHDKLAQTKGHLSQSKDLAEAVSKADLVIEAVPENIELKRKIWKEVGENAPKTAIFTTNTSTILPSSFADSSGDASRFLAYHFANDIWKRRVVEVMGTAKTDPKYVAAVEQFAKDMGMKPVVIKKEQPGYILNSLLVPFLEAASKLYGGGIAEPRDVDAVWKEATGSVAGPFEIMDTVGLRTVYEIHSRKAEATGDEDERNFTKRLQEEYINKGKMGKETNSGFYDYDENGNIRNS